MAGYKRESNGKRFLVKGGMNTRVAPDLVPEGEYIYLQNVRQRILGRITGRPTTGAALYTYPSAPNTIVRLNDTTPNGPASGFVRVIATDSGALYVNGTEVDSGMTGQPPSICINQPDQSVQPWAYIADSSMATVIVSDSQQCTGMIKLRSDMLTRKTGIKEPQYPVQVSINVDSSSLWLSLPATTPPWTNIGGAYDPVTETISTGIRRLGTFGVFYPQGAGASLVLTKGASTTAAATPCCRWIPTVLPAEPTAGRRC